MHVFNNGSTARLKISAWNRDTVADGYWLNTNTIRPLSSRDEYLAEKIDEISAKFVYYYPGENIEFVYNDDNTVTINATPFSEYEIHGENGISAENLTIGLSGGDVNASFKFNYVTANNICGYGGTYNYLSVDNLTADNLFANTATFNSITSNNLYATNLTANTLTSQALTVGGGQNSFKVNNDFEIALEINGEPTKSSLSAVIQGISQEFRNEYGGTLVLNMGSNEGTLSSRYNNLSGITLNSYENTPFYEGDVTTTDYTKDICYDISDYIDRGYNKFIYKDYGTWDEGTLQTNEKPNQHGIIIDVSKLKPFMKYTINVINCGYLSKLYNDIYAGIQFLWKGSDGTPTARLYNVPQIQYLDTTATQSENLMNCEKSWEENYGSDVTVNNTYHKRLVNTAHINHYIELTSNSTNIAVDIPIMMNNNKWWYDANWSEGAGGTGFSADYQGAWVWRNGDSANAVSIDTISFDSVANKTDIIASLIVSGKEKANIADEPSAKVIESSGENISYTNGGFIDFYKGANDEIYFVNMKGGIWKW